MSYLGYLYKRTLEDLRVLNTPYKNELTENSPRISLDHPLIKVPLRPHQAALVHKMLDQEKKLTAGWDLSGETLYGKWSILGDSVGVGKSLAVLSHIAHVKTENIKLNMSELSTNSSPALYSLRSNTYSDISKCNVSLIIVPHSLYRQWYKYIKEQTNLNALCLTNKNTLNDEDFMKKLMDCDIVLMTNTLFPSFSIRLKQRIIFKRVYMDEADSIKISCANIFPEAEFIWLITASYPNILFLNTQIPISYSVMQQRLFAPNSRFHPDFVKQFRSAYESNAHEIRNSYYIVSCGFMKNLLLLNHHPLRGEMVIRSSVDFISKSISLPQLFRHTIVCRAPISYNIISNTVSPEIRSYLHAGDVQSALQALGVADEQATNLVQAVTESKVKELERMKKVYKHKSELEYSTPKAKEEALKALEDKIHVIEDQIKFIKERIENFQSEACPICFDEPADALLTKCCNRVFCAVCILTSLTRSPACPLCRASTHPSSLKRIKVASEENHMVTEPVPEAPKELLKKDALVKLLKENPSGKFLIFSRYDNPFTQITEEITQMNIHVKELKGNKDVIQAALTQFEKGKLQCLLLNSTVMGAGLTITAATHVILLHAMNIEEEKQILGRAYRMGRKEPLHVYRLVHADEIENLN